MKEYVPDYIVAGAATELSCWVKNAAQINILLWCFEYEHRNGNICPLYCNRGGGCAIGVESTFLNVFSVGGVQNMDIAAFEQVLALVPSKKLESRHAEKIRSIISQFVSSFGHGSVACFETRRSSGGQIEWIPFEAL